MPEAARRVFISYSRIDQPLVSRAVEFLRGGGLQVFLDSQSIAYGSDWRQELVKAIEDSERVMLFWTAAAALSRWVTREWKLALKRGKKVVPTLLDETPLPPPLARLHAVTSLRGLFPSPPRRPEEVVQALVQANDFGEEDAPLDDDDGLDPAGELAYLVARTDMRVSEHCPPRASSGFRLGLVAASLAVAGVATWFTLAPSPHGSIPPRPSPVASGVVDQSSTAPEPTPPASGPVDPATAPAKPTPAASAPGRSPAGTPTLPERPPAMEVERLDEFSLGPWVALLAAVLLLLGVPLAWRRWSPGGRARAVVRELYAA